MNVNTSTDCASDGIAINCGVLFQAIAAGVTNVNPATLFTNGGTATFQVPGACTSASDSLGNSTGSACDPATTVSINVLAGNFQACFGGDVFCDSAGDVLRLHGNIESDTAANMAIAGIAYGFVDIGMMQSGRVFGTRLGGNAPVFNNNDYLRIGWSFDREYGQYVFRIGGDWLKWFMGNPHINLWPPSW
jgi:hypothetical protein